MRRSCAHFGLPNRPAFLERVNREIARARHKGKKLGVLFMDLDGFELQAISALQARQVGYEAALKTYSSVQRLSLFQYINP